MTAIPSTLQRRPPALAGPLAVVTSLWRHRELVVRLARRDVVARYRGSWLGISWAIVTPLLFLAAFTFVFHGVLRARWLDATGTGEFALVLFAGLVLFWFLNDCVARAPRLLLENVSYIKKVVFPLEVLPWVVLLGALFHALLGLAALALGVAWVHGVPGWTALLAPLALVPLALMALGLGWWLSALGVFLRDVRQLVPVITTLMLFLSPTFYPRETVPEGFRQWMLLNPLTFPVEQLRAMVFQGLPPDWTGLALATLAGWAVAWLGLAWFRRTRHGFADVV